MCRLTFWWKLDDILIQHTSEARSVQLPKLRFMSEKALLLEFCGTKDVVFVMLIGRLAYLGGRSVAKVGRKIWRFRLC